MNAPVILDRRSVLAGSGALIVSFSLSRAFAEDKAAASARSPPGSLKTSPYLDSWIRIDANGAITAFTGKAELGQGFKTAFQQIAAEQLDVPFASLNVITADTALTANEGYTSGSHSMQDSGTAILHAASQARVLLISEAAKRFDLPVETLRTDNGAVIAGDGRRLGYGELVAGDMLHVQAEPETQLQDPATFKVMGQSVPRVDIPAKVTGGAAYVQDMRLPGMVHARLVRPPSYGAQLTECDTAAVEKMLGVVKVVRDGNFLAVVAKQEFQAIKAMHALSAAAKWQENAKLPKQDDLPSMLMAMPSQDSTIFQRSDPKVAGQKTFEATYTRPYQSHGSIGPSCAVAQFADGKMTVWSHTQGVYPDRQAIAEMLRMPQQDVRVIHVEGSGCYGHNGADDAAADAALIARALPDVFSIESFMDELASLAGADPVEFRLKHLDDSRGRDVIAKAAEGFGWLKAQTAPRDRGFGFAFARYKNLAAYCAVASEVEVNRETGRARLVRAVAAVDSGQVVNPNGLINQIEGAIVQSTSWTLYESVSFDDRRVTSVDWQTYPILRFDAVPESIDVHIINRPGLPFLGSGETGQGPAAASIANAIAHATGKRLRDLPLSRKRIKDAIDA
jgi:CO/xanthine dehydrogenase Mo-binding subunit